jgi:hypothetical protein
MNRYIYFGEVVEGFDVRVLNEREARAGAGILFLFAFLSFMNAFILHNFVYTKIFVTVFMLDFFIRIFINPKYAPSLLLGRVMVQNQVPEYVAAAQKRWAWSIGFILSIIMFLLIIIFEIMTPIKIFICILCLALLYFEAVFGICLGCKVYNVIYKNQAKYCSGGTCEIQSKDDIQRFSFAQKLIVTIFLLTVTTTTYSLSIIEQDKQELSSTNSVQIMKCGAGKCGSGKCGGGK